MVKAEVIPSDPWFGDIYELKLTVKNPTSTTNSEGRAISSTEGVIRGGIDDKETLGPTATRSYSNVFDASHGQTQVYYLQYRHTSDPFRPLREQGESTGYIDPLTTFARAAIDHYTIYFDISKISSLEFFSTVWNAGSFTYDASDFWNKLGCVPRASYDYSFTTDGSVIVPALSYWDSHWNPRVFSSDTSLTQTTAFIDVTAPDDKRSAYGIAMSQEVLAISDSAIGLTFEDAITKFLGGNVCIIASNVHQQIAEKYFKAAVDPVVDYTAPVVLVPYTVPDINAIKPGASKDYLRTLGTTASHADAWEDATIKCYAARQANDTVWETTLLKERYKYLSLLTDDYNTLSLEAVPMITEWKAMGIDPTPADIATTKSNISKNGLSPYQVSLLKSDGYSDENIESIRNLTLYAPDDYAVNFSTTITNSLIIGKVFTSVAMSNLTDDLGPDTPPYADFTASPTTGTAPITVQFTDTSLRGPNQWVWSFGDGATATTQNPAHTYTAAGTYTVNLTVTNSTTGSDTRTKYEYITVYPPPPVANFTANVTSGQVPLAVAFTDASSNMPTQWAWDFGDGSNATLKNPIHIYLKPGNYTVSLKATNLGGSNTLTRIGYITVRPIPWKVEILPNVINLKSKGVFIAFVELPKPYDANKVINGTVFCNGAPAKTLIRIGKFPKVFGAIFRTSDLKGVQSGNKVQFTVNGTVNYNGQLLAFSGNDSVRVLNLRITTRDDTEDIASQSASIIFDKYYNKK